MGLGEDLGGRLAAQAVVGSSVVVVGNVRIELVKQVLALVGGFEVNMLPFNRAPEALDEGVVGGAASAVAADAAAGDQQRLFKDEAGELAALVGIKNMGRWCLA